MGHQMKLHLTRVGLLVKLANHYITRGALCNVVEFTKFCSSMWHKTEWMGHPMKLELTRVGSLV